MNLKESDLLLLEVAHLAIGTTVDKLSFSERDVAVWKAFQLGKAYSEALAEESAPSRGRKGSADGRTA